MSIHKSLVVRSKLQRSRNVWSRVERIEELEEDGRFRDGDSVFALPKVRTRFKVKTHKKAKEEEKPAEEQAPAE